jgi:hypothetical protein
VAKAPADGYTLLFNASTFTTGPMVVKSAPYDVNRDFTPVVLVAQAPLAVSVNNDVPAKDIAGLMAHAKANPGKLNFAIGSTGSAGHLSTELLKRAGGVDLTIVPYKGTAPAFQDLVGGQIEGFIDPLLGAMNFHKAGKLRIVAVTSKGRVPTLPDVPTVGESVPGYEFYSWYGLWGPAKLPGRHHRQAQCRGQQGAGLRHARQARGAGPDRQRRLGGRLRALPARRHGALAEDHHGRQHPCRVSPGSRSSPAPARASAGRWRSDCWPTAGA